MKVYRCGGASVSFWLHRFLRCRNGVTGHRAQFVLAEAPRISMIRPRFRERFYQKSHGANTIFHLELRNVFQFCLPCAIQNLLRVHSRYLRVALRLTCNCLVIQNCPINLVAFKHSMRNDETKHASHQYPLDDERHHRPLRCFRRHVLRGSVHPEIRKGLLSRFRLSYQ